MFDHREPKFRMRKITDVGEYVLGTILHVSDDRRAPHMTIAEPSGHVTTIDCSAPDLRSKINLLRPDLKFGGGVEIWADSLIESRDGTQLRHFVQHTRPFEDTSPIYGIAA